jgi:GalNAc-alpha-(1->4)-GalNAc-alpha-(1->3)-diNAcBac-PP-undecaprenol alpha-1,4-N-acetyl-D-galactosaminyltransferase
MPNQPNNNNPPNILLVISSLSAGGAERVLTLLARGFLDQGHRVDVATIFGRQNDFYALPDGVGRIALDMAGETTGLIDKVSGNFCRIRALRRAIRQAKPDLIISFLPETNVLTILAGIGLGIPVIATEHVDPYSYPMPRLWRCLRRLTYPRAARLVSVSFGVDKAFSWLPASRRAVIYNPVCLDQLALSPSALPVYDWSHTITAMGRLEVEKGFDLLIDAFGQVTADFPDWGLVIYGEGSLREKLSAQIESLGLAERIRLPGVTAAPAVALRQSDLFVLSSRYEGFGLTLVEAMSCGLPVVATDCPCGPSEIVHPDVDTLVVPRENATAMAQAMSRLMSDPAERRRLGENARLSAQRFSLDAAMQAWEREIQTCFR